ncbi:hypothetical protein HELRODRAFT_188195 [Helobdella robusta]|uniref:Uncharacterized protein n=1 Tax=Helobdella robusta TaxID=6412 RepID=T1FPR6_HELRO|nr:hypothetical protein HELRODRAFT_188195 [Helobdella robusta]ESO05840.1 hypothetical protein HELRODRAFT_188195 [Helobdella robusta]
MTIYIWIVYMENHTLTMTNTNVSQDSGKMINSDINKENTSAEGPNIEAALSMSPKSAEKLLAGHKPTIGGRIAPSKKGAGGAKKGGLGAQKVTTNFAEIESAALQKEKEVPSAIKDHKSKPDNDKDNYISMNLAYKELAIDENKRAQQFKNFDPKKLEQAERLGMGSGGTRLVSHSATSDMQCINQENPTNGSAHYKMDRYSSRGSKNNNDDDFEVINDVRSFQMKSNYFDAKHSSDDRDFNDKSNWTKKSSRSMQENDFGGAGFGGYGGSSSSGSGGVVAKDDDDRGRSRKAYPVPSVETSSEAQQKFGNAKAISSDQFFGGTRDIDYEAKQNLRKFEGSNAISSSELFGGAPDNSRSKSIA